MKLNFFIVTLNLCFVGACQQQKDELINQSSKITSIQETTEEKLKSDEVVFEQFKFLAYCKCLDELYDVNEKEHKVTFEKTKNFENAFIQYYDLQLALARLMKKDKLELMYADFIKLHRDSIYYRLKERDENIPLMPMIVCDRMVKRKNSELKILYLDLIRQEENYAAIADYQNDYVKGIGYIGKNDW